MMRKPSKNVAFKFISDKDLMQALVRTVEGKYPCICGHQAAVWNFGGAPRDRGNVKDQVDQTLETWGYHFAGSPDQWYHFWTKPSRPVWARWWQVITWKQLRKMKARPFLSPKQRLQKLKVTPLKLLQKPNGRRHSWSGQGGFVPRGSGQRVWARLQNRWSRPTWIPMWSYSVCGQKPLKILPNTERAMWSFLMAAAKAWKNHAADHGHAADGW